ncbi:hypothetical protein Gotri_017557, partial [Gossypium trilobum]|nr:hypothetical protein [Gossypium trilobum]
MAFSGTTEKCRSCDKTVHFIEMVSVDGVPYHKTCFRCSHCKGLLVVPFLWEATVKGKETFIASLTLSNSLGEPGVTLPK